MSRTIYTARRDLTAAQFSAASGAFHALATVAREEVRARRSMWARYVAAQARSIIVAFTVRIDGKAASPFPHAAKQRPECLLCGRSAITGDLVCVQVTLRGRTLGPELQCTACLAHTRTLYDDVEVVDEVVAS